MVITACVLRCAHAGLHVSLNALRLDGTRFESKYIFNGNISLVLLI